MWKNRIEYVRFLAEFQFFMQGAVLDRFFGRIHGFPWNDKPVSIHHHSVVGIFIVVVVIVTCTIVAVQMARLIVLVVVWFGNHRVAVTICQIKQPTAEQKVSEIFGGGGGERRIHENVRPI